MNCKNISLVAIFSLLILIGGRYTPAQAPEWSKATSAAMAAKQRGEYTVAEKLYKDAMDAMQKELEIFLEDSFMRMLLAKAGATPIP